MSDWHIQDSSDIKTLSDARLRKKLRKGDLTGLELARPEASSAWVPLHSLPVFREEVPMVADADGARVAARRALVGFGWHLAAFLGVIGWFTMTAGFPFWAAFWGIGLVLHGVKTLPALGALQGASASLAAGPVLAPTATAAADPAPPATGFLADLDGALAGLAAAAASVGAPPPDAGGIRAAAASLHTRRVALEAAADRDTLDRLSADRAELAARHEGAPDVRTAEAYATELAALDDRLAAAQAALATADRLAARERALLHQVAALRASTLQAGAGEPSGPDLAEQAATLRDEVRAADEVDEALARARRAARGQQTR